MALRLRCEQPCISRGLVVGLGQLFSWLWDSKTYLYHVLGFQVSNMTKLFELSFEGAQAVLDAFSDPLMCGSSRSPINQTAIRAQ